MSVNLNLGGLFFLFLVLKLTSIITWSWWWVTCPLWIGPVLSVLFVMFVTGLALLSALIGAIARR